MFQFFEDSLENVLLGIAWDLTIKYTNYVKRIIFDSVTVTVFEKLLPS